MTTDHPTAKIRGAAGVRAARSAIWIAAGVLFLAALHGLINYETRLRDLSSATIYVIGPLVVGVLHLLLLRLRRETLVVIVIVEVFALTGIYAAEGYLEFFDPVPIKSLPGQNALFDWQLVIENMRSDGAEIYPNVAGFRGDILGRFDPATRARHRLQGSQLMTLGAISNIDTLLCRDSGADWTWRKYRSDRHGFNNPDGLWGSADIEVAAIGDSFTQGVCVAPEDHMMATIRERFPRTLNLGIARTGPLHQLAVMREYLSHVKPPVVVWFFTENNDLYTDLNGELMSPLMNRYLDPGFNQNLIERQPLIDELLKALVDSRISNWRETENNRKRPPPAYNWAKLATSLITSAKLNHLRGIFGLAIQPGAIAHKQRLFDAYASILAEGQRTVKSWGGKLYVVFLPTHSRYLSWRSRRVWDEQRARVLADLVKLNIPIIDMLPVFASHPDPLRLFQGHYSPEGYRLVGETVVKSLDASINQR